MSSTATIRNLVVLGMHRSGTSMIAGALVRCGLHAGTPDSLLSAQADNPLGFWERRDTVELNDRLLEAAGGSWFNPAVELPSAAQAQEQMSRLIADLQSPWLLKDPRLVLTWPLWEPCLDNPVVLCVYRDAMAVAESLRRRNGFPLDYGLALWEYYNRLLAVHMQQEHCVVVDYDKFQTDPAGELAELLKRLERVGMPISGPLPEVESYWSAELNHFSPGDASESALVSESQRQLQESWQASLADPAAAASIAPPDQSLVLRLRDFAKAYQASAAARVLEIELANTRKQMEQEREDRAHEYAVLKDQHDNLYQLHLNLREIRERESRSLAAARLDQERLSRELAASNRAERDLQASVEESREGSQRLQAELERAYRGALDYRHSALGKLQHLLSGIYKTLTLRRGMNTSFDNIIDAARTHFGLLDKAPEGRLQMIARVLGYVARNPVSSARSFSWHRLKILLGQFSRADTGDLSLWVKQRFPTQQHTALAQAAIISDEELEETRLDFPEVEQPLVSIVIPAFNEYAVTLTCLRSILTYTSDVDVEVIVADDASSDLTAGLGERITGAVHCRSETNQGFVRNCNTAAALARGKYLLLLNNDTAVTAGWLKPLLDLLEQRPDVGVVGPKLLFASGELQEAGGIVWEDATGWNYGRMDDPELPEYNYVKSVDYISGACLLTRRSLWEQLGGFDERYVPAYYEDTDYCFAVRAAGYEVMYQPASTIFHFEGISNGTDLGSGIKRYQVENRIKFEQKWRSTLQQDHYRNGENVFAARDRSGRRRTVLVIDHYVPHFDKDAGSRSTWLYLQLLVEMGYNVKFMGANFFPHQPYTRQLQQAGIEVLVGERMARQLESWLQSNAPLIDAIYIHRPHIVEQFREVLQAMSPRPRLVYFGHDLHYLRTEREAELTGDTSLLKEAKSWRGREFEVFRMMDTVYYPSQVEVDAIKGQLPELNVRAIPLYVYDPVEAVRYMPAERADMLFVGGFNHPPNADGLRWFVAEVLPLLAAAQSAMRLHIVGSNMPEEISQLAGNSVVVHGFLSDEALAELYTKVALVVVPLRFGAGVKGKVIEALQHGLPLVTTAIGAEGLPNPEQVMQVANSAAEFSAAILSVEQQDASSLGLLKNYPEYFNENFGKARAMQIVSQDFGEPQRQLR